MSVCMHAFLSDKRIINRGGIYTDFDVTMTSCLEFVSKLAWVSSCCQKKGLMGVLRDNSTLSIKGEVNGIL